MFDCTVFNKKSSALYNKVKSVFHNYKQKTRIQNMLLLFYMFYVIKMLRYKTIRLQEDGSPSSPVRSLVIGNLTWSASRTWNRDSSSVDVDAVDREILFHKWSRTLPPPPPPHQQRNGGPWKNGILEINLNLSLLFCVSLGFFLFMVCYSIYSTV